MRQIDRDQRRSGSLKRMQACLQIIDDAFRRVRGDTEAAFFGLDDRGYCFIARQTHRSIATLWSEMAASRTLEGTSPTRSHPAAGFAPFGASPPVWAAKAHPPDTSVSGELATEAGVIKIVPDSRL